MRLDKLPTSKLGRPGLVAVLQPGLSVRERALVAPVRRTVEEPISDIEGIKAARRNLAAHAAALVSEAAQSPFVSLPLCIRIA